MDVQQWGCAHYNFFMTHHAPTIVFLFVIFELIFLSFSKHEQ